jgi:hypothetical protein
LVLPELVDQVGRRDRVVGVEQQDGEQGALLGTAELQRRTVDGRLDRTEHPKLHGDSLPPESTQRTEA